MKLATTTGDLRAYTDTAGTLKHFKQAGFRYLDYNFGSDFNDGTGAFSKEWRAYIDNLQKTAESLQMQFVQAHAPMGSPIIENDKQKALIDGTKRCIEICAILGIKNLVVHSGYDYGLSKEETFAKNKVFYLDLLHFAENYDVNILTENFNKMIDERYWVDNAQDLKELIGYVDHPLFHACWDAGHGNLQELPQHEALKILGEQVYAVHVQDNLGDIDSHMSPFFGSLNLDSFMYGLQEIGYQGYFTFEATKMMQPVFGRRSFEKDQRLFKVPLDLRVKAEGLLFEIGKCVLEAYDCFEE